MVGADQPWGLQAWSVEGTAPGAGPGEPPYQGKLVAQPSGDIWLMKWQLDGFGELVGAGAMHNGELIVTRNPSDTPRQGLVWYTPSLHDWLVATWNRPSIGDRLAGGLAPGNAIPGEFEITYYTPIGNPYPPLHLTIGRAEDAQVYSLLWKGGPDDLFGVGLDTSDGICAAWGSNKPITVLRYAPPTDGYSTAISADTEHATTGQEVIKRLPI
jgi:hypothetical protein